MLAILLTGCAVLHPSGARLAQLEQQLARQQAEIFEMQTRLEALERGAPAAAQTGHPDEATEAAAAEQMSLATTLIGEFRMAEARVVVDALVAKYPGTRGARSAERSRAELSLIGEPAAPIQAEYWFNREGSFADGRLTLVVFGEAWCPHCKHELPRVQALYAELAPLGLNVLFFTRITKSSTREKMQELMDEVRVTFPVAKESGDAMTNGYHVTGIPAAALVRDGVVIWRGHPARLDAARLRGLLQ